MTNEAPASEPRKIANATASIGSLRPRRDLSRPRRHRHGRESPRAIHETLLALPTKGRASLAAVAGRGLPSRTQLLRSGEDLDGLRAGGPRNELASRQSRPAFEQFCLATEPKGEREHEKHACRDELQSRTRKTDAELAAESGEPGRDGAHGDRLARRRVRALPSPLVGLRKATRISRPRHRVDAR